MKSKLVFLEFKSSVYGGQKALLARCRQLDIQNIEYTIIHPYRNSLFLDQVSEISLKGNIVKPYKCLEVLSKVYVIRAVFVLLTLMKLYFPRKSIIVHADSFDSAYIAIMLKKFFLLSGLKVIFTIRSERYLRFNFIDRFFLNSVNVLITNSNFSKEKIKVNGNVKSHDILVNFSPIDFDKIPYKCISRKSSSEIKISYVGSFEERKRLDLFVDFCLELKNNYPDIEFVFNIFGDAKSKKAKELVDDVSKVIDKSSFSTSFLWRGYCDLPEMINSTDALLCLYENEPFGRVVPEFLYAGVPVLVNDDGGLVEAGLGYALKISGVSVIQKQECFIRLVMKYIVNNDSEHNLSTIRSNLKNNYDAQRISNRDIETYDLFNKVE